MEQLTEGGKYKRKSERESAMICGQVGTMQYNQVSIMITMPNYLNWTASSCVLKARCKMGLCNVIYFLVEFSAQKTFKLKFVKIVEQFTAII